MAFAHKVPTGLANRPMDRTIFKNYWILNHLMQIDQLLYHLSVAM